MKNHAIHQALSLKKHPEEMAWLCFPDSEYPEGMTELLRLCASEKQLKDFSSTYQYDSVTLKKALINYLEKAVLIHQNSPHKQLALESDYSKQKQKNHYQLLMKIFHPDINPSEKASYYSSMITNANKKLQTTEEMDTDFDTSINVSESRTPPKSFYAATQSTENQISNVKTAFAFVAALFVITLVAVVGHFNDPANPDLITQKTDAIEVQSSASVENGSELTSSPQFIMAGVDADPVINTDISDAQLQQLLKSLELAYEKGDVKKIKPILANSPDIKSQSDQEINQKLNTLFEITKNRKMVLHGFEWNSVSNQIKAKGKFISRYQLVGEEKWLTREGVAKVIFESKENKLTITQVSLENFTID